MAGAAEVAGSVEVAAAQLPTVETACVRVKSAAGITAGTPVTVTAGMMAPVAAVTPAAVAPPYTIDRTEV